MVCGDRGSLKQACLARLDIKVGKRVYVSSACTYSMLVRRVTHGVAEFAHCCVFFSLVEGNVSRLTWTYGLYSSLMESADS